MYTTQTYVYVALYCVLYTRYVRQESWGFPGGASGREPACQCRRHKRRRFNPWVSKIPWKRTWQPTPGFLPGESQGQRNLVGYSPQGRTESDMIEAT